MKKSFLQSFVFVGRLLLIMGAAFLGVAILMQLIPLEPESINVYSNGVRQPSTDETVSLFRLIFLMAFGIPGLGLMTAGAIVLGRAKATNRTNQRLKYEGVCVKAKAVEFSTASLRVNNRRLGRLLCTYEHSDGNTYIFKSGFLRVDPMPFLKGNQVTVYYDMYNINSYFVDVDGSVGLGDNLIEL